MTHKPPVRNRADIPIFSMRGSCSFLTSGMGAKRIAKSVSTQGIGTITVNIAELPQCPCTAGFQLLWIGKHMNTYPKKEDMNHAKTMAPKMRTAI